jgi:hypothetical protein
MDRKIYIDKLAAQLKQWDAELQKIFSKLFLEINLQLT